MAIPPASLSEPSEPILASALRDLESSYEYLHQLQENQAPSAIGAPTQAIGSGIRSLDLSLGEVWRGGRIIGVGNISEAKAAEGSGGRGGAERSNNVNPSLPSHIIANTLFQYHQVQRHRQHLAQLGQTQRLPSSQPEIYLISAPSATTISETHELLSRRYLQQFPVPTNTQTEAERRTRNGEASKFAVERLSSTHLLRYFDPVGVIEALSEVTSLIATPTELASVDSPHTSNSKHKTRSSSPSTSVKILLLQSLPQTLSVSYRRNGLERTNALLSSILRALTHLSRSSPSTLILVELELGITLNSGRHSSGSGSMMHSAFSSPRGEVMKVIIPGLNKSTYHGSGHAERSNVISTNRDTAAISSTSVDAIATSGGNNNGSDSRNSISNSNTTISTLLSSAMDTIIIIHDAFGMTSASTSTSMYSSSTTTPSSSTTNTTNQPKTSTMPSPEDKHKDTKIVEVVKDRTGRNFGSWALWARS